MSKNIDLLTIFSNNMRIRRKKLGFTQKDLANKCEISSSFITDIELCKKAPSFNNINKIAKALEAPPWSFFIENGNSISTKSNRDEILSETLKYSISLKIDEILNISK